MKAKDVIAQFSLTGVISDTVIELVQENEELRKNLLAFVENNPQHSFPRALLKELIQRRQDPQEEIYADDLMYAGYLVTVRQDISDSLLLWQAKTVDFDTYCGFDIHLVMFAGAKQTIEYLKTLPPEDSEEAISYIEECTEEAKQLADYFSKQLRPYYI